MRSKRTIPELHGRPVLDWAKPIVFKVQGRCWRCNFNIEVSSGRANPATRKCPVCHQITLRIGA